MHTDITGKKRMKIGLHIHTTVSDGHATPQQSAQIFRNAGFDAVAFTDHWKWRADGEEEGLRIISGCEYNVGGGDTVEGVFHIVAIGAKSEPVITDRDDPQHVIDAIHAAGGIAILAHPAWSLNSVKQVTALKGIDATEIYNTMSGICENNRPYSGAIVDLLANEGFWVPLVADDDSHKYAGDAAVSYIMVDVTDGKTDTADIIGKIAAGEFYATQGPEVHVGLDGSGKVMVRTTPSVKISFYSQIAWARDRVWHGEDMTYAEYTPKPFEKWIRVEVEDADGRSAWSNIIRL